MRIWLGTWNVEQKFPSDGQIMAWLNKRGYQDADIVALGFQEASREGMPPNIPNFVHLNTMRIDGRTKTTRNAQLLFIYHRMNARHNQTIRVMGKFATTISPVQMAFPVGEYGKGATFMVFESQDIMTNGSQQYGRIAICSAHLDSKNSETRREQIQRILGQLEAECAAQKIRWDVCFFMGDLNYRLRQGGRIAANTVTPEKLQEYIWHKRAALFGHDTLDEIQRSNNPDFPGDWTFPPPWEGVPGTGYYIPTYKIKYKNVFSHQGPRGQVIQGPKLQPYDIKVDQQNHVQLSNREDQYDLGWLDRIGYSTRSGATVTLMRSGSCPDLELSDHICIYSVFDVFLPAIIKERY